MRVFISYAHQPPDNAAFVERVRARLAQDGIATWKDETGIAHGESWRRAIIQGLRNSDYTIAFLSKQSVRDPGVCLDELNIALHVKGGAILPVLIEPETEVGAPHHIAHRQWIHMEDWRTAGDAWFEVKVQEILTVLRDPAEQRLAAEIGVLERVLKPIEQAAAISEKIEGFVGREWMRAALDTKRNGSLPRRLIWITGGPGTGKSAFAAWLATWHRGSTIALNLCEAGVDARNDPAQVVRTIGYQLARRAEDFRDHLLHRLARLHHADVRLDTPEDAIRAIEGNLAAIDANLRKMQPEALFDWLLAEPLHLCIDGTRSLVLLDGLDETLRDGECPLADLLAQRAARLPAWLAIAATSRDVAAIRAIFAQLEPLRLDAGDHETDLRVYALGWLGAGQDALVDRVVAASGGTFLYLTLLRQAVENGWMRLASPEGLPRGLTGIYRRWFRHLFPDKARYETEYLPLLSVLTVARQPVPLSVLTELFGWTARQRARVRRDLDTLFPVRNEAMAPFHTSLRDWLRGTNDLGAGPDYMADEDAGVTRLAGTLWPRFTAWIAKPPGTHLDAFTRTELPALALRQTEAALRTALNSAGPWGRVADAFVGLAQSAARSYAWAESRDWWSLLATAAGLHGAAGLDHRRWAWAQIGDIETTLGRTAAAAAAFQKYNTAAAALAEADPGNAGWRRDLSVSHNKIGDVKMARGDLTGALLAYDASMEIRKSLAEADPGNAGWRRDMAVSLVNLATVKSGLGDAAGATAHSRAALAVLDGMAAAGMHLDPQAADMRQQLTARFAG